MLPLFDLMMKAQNGDAIEAMSRQFGLAQEQMTQAMTALMPAFSTGLKRTATDPYDFSKLMAAASSGNYTQYFEDMTKAFSPQGVSDGNAMLGQIFGSKEVSRAIADQAAQMSGIGQDIYKQMLPVVANAVVGGFLKQMAGQFKAAGEAISSGNSANLMDVWLQSAGMAEKPKPNAPSMFDNPFMQSMQSMHTAFTPKPTADKTDANPFANNPFMQMFENMTRGGTAAEPAPSEAKRSSEAEANPMATVISQMFESGLEVQKSYQKNMDAIFDSYLSGTKTSNPDRK